MRTVASAAVAVTSAIVVMAWSPAPSRAQEQPGVEVVNAPAAANGPTPVNVAAPAAPDAGGGGTQPAPSTLNGGSFSSEYLHVTIPDAAPNANGNVVGTLTRGRHDYPFQPLLRSDTSMSGTFKDEYGNTYR